MLASLGVLATSCEGGEAQSGEADSLLEPTDTKEDQSANVDQDADSKKEEHFLSNLKCKEGEYPSWDNTKLAWKCQGLVALPQCTTEGNIPVQINGQWVCRSDQTISNLGSYDGLQDCAEGYLMKWSEGKWSCQPDRQKKDTTLPNHPDLLTEIQCAEGKILRWSAQGWGCSDDRDPDKIANTDYLAGLSCSNSNSVRWNCNPELDM